MNHVFTEIKNHFFHYLILFFILLFGLFSFFYLKKNPQAQILSLFLTSSFYVIWGVVHHLLEDDFHLRILLEYLAVALLGFLIVFTLIERL